jgi:thiamine kinase-like enzyme
VLEQAPRTLVHTDPYPRNILQPEAGVRVWIDWEDALFGPAALDLAAWLLEGPWSLGRSLDRTAALDVYCAARVQPVDRRQLERTLDAAVIASTLGQNLTALARESPDGLRVLVDERVAALDRLA